jgi:hypothetical protein
VQSAGLCARHLVIAPTAAERHARQTGARQLSEEDMCADGCGRPALLTGPRCRRCHIAVAAPDRATAA